MNFFEKELKVRLTFTEEILGSSPASQEIYREYIASNVPSALRQHRAKEWHSRHPNQSPQERRLNLLSDFSTQSLKT